MPSIRPAQTYEILITKYPYTSTPTPNLYTLPRIEKAISLY
ncbi:hypothetical protein [Anaerocolumna aminovalerica]|nr:hypothetical protein [Anaerocolumna aminovalerica]